MNISKKYTKREKESHNRPKQRIPNQSNSISYLCLF
nr:MAG TPA: hypothetical protein [Caudoviricetes sp.]